MHITGGDIQCVDLFLTIPGASSCILNVEVSYARASSFEYGGPELSYNMLHNYDKHLELFPVGFMNLPTTCPHDGFLSYTN
jgi:hypothetical protein